jgi:hypothetical protein
MRDIDLCGDEKFESAYHYLRSALDILHSLAKLARCCTDMDEPVKTVGSFIPWDPLLSGHGGSAPVLEARRLSTVNHSDIRGLLP